MSQAGKEEIGSAPQKQEEALHGLTNVSVGYRTDARKQRK